MIINNNIPTNFMYKTNQPTLRLLAVSYRYCWYDSQVLLACKLNRDVANAAGLRCRGALWNAISSVRNDLIKCSSVQCNAFDLMCSSVFIFIFRF